MVNSFEATVNMIRKIPPDSFGVYMGFSFGSYRLGADGNSSPMGFPKRVHTGSGQWGDSLRPVSKNILIC